MTLVGAPAPAVAGPPAPPQRLPRALVAAVVAVLVVGALLALHAARSGWSVGPALLRDSDTVAVTVDDRGGSARVLSVQVRGLVPLAPGALDSEVTAAQERGVPPVHDAGRRPGRGRHTYVIAVRPHCPAATSSASVVVQVADGRLHTVVRPLSAAARGRLECRPVTLTGGLSPVPGPAGEVDLLLTAYVGQVGAAAPHLQALVWPGFHVSPPSGVVGPALAAAAVDESITFGVGVTADCATPERDPLLASLADGQLPVTLTPAATGRVQALRARCRR